MDCELILKGNISEIEQVVQLLKKHPFSDVLKMVTHVGHPQDFTVPTIEEGDTLGDFTPLPPAGTTDTPAERISEPARRMGRPRTREEIKPQQAIPCESPKCGQLFIPKREGQRTCSARCYSVWWYYEKKKKEPVVQDAPAPVPAQEAPPPESKPHATLHLKRRGRKPKQVKIPKSQEGENFRIFTVAGKATQVFGSPEQLDNFENRLKEQQAQLSRKFKSGKKVLQEIMEEKHGED